MSKWKVEHRCVDCDHRMSQSDRYNHEGVCPHCGRDGHYVADTKKLMYKLVPTGPKPAWYKFWARQWYRRLYKDEDDANKLEALKAEVKLLEAVAELEAELQAESKA